MKLQTQGYEIPCVLTAEGGKQIANAELISMPTVKVPSFG